MTELSSKITIKEYPPFKGGYKFTHFTNKDFPHEVEKIDLPSKVLLRLKQRYGDEVKSLVKVGEKVQAGQIIGRDDDSISSPIIASISGEVTDVREISYGAKNVKAIEITSAGDQTPLKLIQDEKHPLEKSSEEIGEIIYKSGVSGLGKAGLPTKFHSSVIAPHKVEEIIVNVLQTEPFVFPHAFMLENYSDKIAIALQILKRMYPQARINLTISKENAESFQFFLETVCYKDKRFNEELTVHLLSPKYPQEQEKILMQTLYDIHLPLDKGAINYGIVMLNAYDLLPIYEAVVEGKPLTRRMLYISGSGVDKERIVDVNIGALISDFVDFDHAKHSLRSFSGSVFYGREMQSFNEPVNRAMFSLTVLEKGEERRLFSFLNPGFNNDSFTNTFMSSLLPFIKKKVSTNIEGDKRECVSCNYCDQVCPVGILPHYLFKLIENGFLDEAIRYQLTACVNCGLCTYVCPCKLDLSSTIYEHVYKVHGE